jgi:hypothetical protein
MKSIKRSIIIGALSSLAVFLGCTGGNNAAKETAANAQAGTQAGTTGSQKPVRLGFVLATMNEERYAKDRNYFMEF